MAIIKIGPATKSALIGLAQGPGRSLSLGGNIKYELLKKDLASCLGQEWTITNTGLAALAEREKQDQATNKKNNPKRKKNK